MEFRSCALAEKFVFGRTSRWLHLGLHHLNGYTWVGMEDTDITLQNVCGPARMYASLTELLEMFDPPVVDQTSLWSNKLVGFANTRSCMLLRMFAEPGSLRFAGWTVSYDFFRFAVYSRLCFARFPNHFINWFNFPPFWLLGSLGLNVDFFIIELLIHVKFVQELVFFFLSLKRFSQKKNIKMKLGNGTQQMIDRQLITVKK